jgi:hypothetical protein
MPIIEQYNFDPKAGPRNCQHEVPSNHKAELILHEKPNTDVFAQTVVELALSCGVK